MAPSILLIDLWPDPLADGQVRDRFQDIPPLAKARGLTVDSRHFQSLPPPSQTPPRAVILSGSSTNLVDDPQEDPDDGAPLTRFAEVLDLLAAWPLVPVLGICFGHQLLAKAGGGQLERLQQKRSVGHFPIEPLLPEPLFAGMPSRPAFAQNHAWRVAVPAPGYRVIARSEDGIEMVRHGTTPRVGVQFHPEYYRRQPCDQAWGRLFLEHWFQSLGV